MEEIVDLRTTAPVTTVVDHGQANRRHGSRTPTLCSLIYSCMDSGTMLIGDGVVTDLSSSGVGIRGNESVTPGMEVTLFIDLPGTTEPFCITQSKISWANGSRFGVTMETLTLEEKNHLRFFL